MASTTADQMSAQQRAEEEAALEVSNTLTNLDHALARARRAHAALQKSGIDPNAEHALADLVESLQSQRKRFVQQAYYATPNQTRMF